MHFHLSPDQYEPVSTTRNLPDLSINRYADSLPSGTVPAMIFCILAKLAGTLIGCLWLANCSGGELLGFAVLGILPIWLEVAATWITGIEPSLATSPFWRYLDAIVDAASFLIAPTLWFYLLFGLGTAQEMQLALALIFFAGMGIYRLARFLKRGLVDGQFFEGLPVTYTGYVWLPAVWLRTHGFITALELGLAVLGILMVWTGLKIKRTQTRNDAP